MSTIDDDGFDYASYVKATPPDPTEIRRGLTNRQHRLDAALMRLAVRIDADLLNQFRQLVSEGRSCERLVNQALREWLSAKGIMDLIRTEIQQAVQQSLSSGHVREESSEP
jgi:hypothetical protein